MCEDTLGKYVAKTETTMAETTMATRVRLRITTGPAFSWMTTMIPIFRDFNPTEQILQKSASIYTVSICRKKELQGQKCIYI